MKKEISTNQACIILMLSILALKLLSLPSFIHISAGNDGFLTIFFILCVDFLMILIFFAIRNKFPNKKFAEICEFCFGNLITKIILFLIFFVLSLKLVMIVWESFTYFRETIFKDVTLPVYLILVFITSISLVYFGLNSFARTSEFFFYLIALALFSSLIVVLLSGKVQSLFPILKDGISPSLKAIFDYASWFGDYFFLFILIDKIKFEENTKKKVLFSLLIVGIYIIAFFVVFYGVYTITSPGHKNAITDIVRFAKKISTVDLLDWLPVLTMIPIIILQVTLYLFMLKEIYEQTVNIKSSKYFISFFVVTVFVLSSLYLYNIQILDILFVEYLKYFAVFLFYLLPILLYIVQFIKRRKYERKIA